MVATVLTVLLLLVIAVSLSLAIPALRRHARQRSAAIGAEIWAADIIEGYQEESRSSQKIQEGPKMVYRWKRIAIFALAALSFLTFIVTGVLAPLTSLSWHIPLLALVLSASGIFVLRWLALRDLARKRINRAPEAQVSQVILKPQGEATAAPKPKVTELHASASGAQQERPVKHSQQKPINYASKSLRYARTHHAPEAVAEVSFKKLPSGSIELEEQKSLEAFTWQVRETPRPTYLDAEVKFREETPSFELLPDEKSQSANLAEAAAKASQLNLDDVLLRRRAQ